MLDQDKDTYKSHARTLRACIAEVLAVIPLELRYTNPVHS
jgi:hypothetical protein